MRLRLSIHRERRSASFKETGKGTGRSGLSNFLILKSDQQLSFKCAGNPFKQIKRRHSLIGARLQPSNNDLTALGLLGKLGLSQSRFQPRIPNQSCNFTDGLFPFEIKTKFWILKLPL